MAVSPAAAAQPMSGGIPPTRAPIQVLTTVTAFNGVYMPAYKTMFERPRNETVGLTPKYSAPTPVAPASMANNAATRGDTSFRTRGLFLVRDILASEDGS